MAKKAKQSRNTATPKRAVLSLKLGLIAQGTEEVNATAPDELHEELSRIPMLILDKLRVHLQRLEAKVWQHQHQRILKSSQALKNSTTLTTTIQTKQNLKQE